MTATKAQTDAYLDALTGADLPNYACESCGRESNPDSGRLVEITLRHIVKDAAGSLHQAKSGLCMVRAEVARRYDGQDSRHKSDINALAVDPCPMVCVAALGNPVIPVALSFILCEREEFIVRRALWGRYDELSATAKAALAPEFGVSGDEPRNQ